MVGSDKVKNMFKKKFPSLSSLGSDGNTSFLRAARAGHLDKVLEQLRNNVDINTSNANGLNALHLASKDGHVHVVTELLKRGANVDSATKKGNTALHIASLAGQEEVVRLLVEHGASVNVQSQNGFTPLYMAAQENHDNVVKYLLANGANQSLATEDGFTPLAVAMQQGHDKVVAVLLENDTRGKVRLPALHIAAKKDDCKAAALLLQNEHNPDVTSKSGFTPLHIASHYGNEGIANLLLNKGADVNYSAKHNITPLHVAAKWGKSNMVSLLLEKGANIESKTRDGLTPLHCAARSGHEQVVDMLLERGAPISCKTKNGLAPLHMSSQGDHVDAARILLYHRAPVDEVTVDYLTALHVAAHCGHARVAKLLLDRKADPNARALNGFTPLHIACKKNRIKVVELLLKHGASIEATTESGLTPLHVASFMGCMNIVIYLLQNEASPDVPTVRGETPLHLAARANQTDIIRILLRNGAQVDARAREQQTPLHIASRLGNVDIVMLLLQHGAAVDCTTKDLYSALHIAAKEGQDEVASVLLENGASPTATTKKGFTPLHLAAKYGNMKVARLLLQRDSPVDAQGKNGVTPLHVASHYDHQNVALLLLDKGASPHATAKNGHTPLHIAAKKNQMDIATTLLEYGAKASAESKAGFTPLHLSAQEGHIDMSSLLIDHQADTNHKAKNGLTPLHLCAQEDRVNVASVLVKNGAEVDATTKAGYTPLHVACHFGQLNMVRFLVEEGGNVGASTAVGYTPLHQAAQQGHCAVINTLLEHGAPPNATTNQGQTAMSIAQKLGYISVVETLKGVTEPTTITPSGTDEKYKVVSPETMQETFMSDSEDEGGEDTLLSEQPYRYLTVDEMKSLGDDSLPIDVRQDERMDSNRECMSMPPTAVDDTISPQHLKEAYSQFTTPDNIDISRHPLHVGFLVSFLVDARGGAMRGCRHSGVRVIVPPRRASMPMRVTCRYLKRDKLSHPPPLMEGEALASRILELGPVGAKFLGPVMIEVPHFGSLRGKEREIVILRSDNGETWREHTVDCSEEAVQDVLSHSFDKEDMAQLDESSRTTRILTTDFPHYLAVVTRVRQEVHAIGPEGGMVSSSVVPQVQAVFPQGALTKKIKVGLQAQPISAELAAKLLGNRVAVSPIVTVEPRRRKFHKPITLTIPKPQAANKGMINQYSGDAPTLRLLCSITGGTTRAQWEDVTGSTPFTFVNDCVSFTTTVSARFWLMDCRNVGDATKMATELYREAIHVPFMAKFVVFAKRVDPLEARLRIFCMTDDKEDKTLEHQEHFTEVAKSRDVEVLEGKTQYVEFAGNLVPVTKSGEQLQLSFRAFRENRLPFTVRVKDPHADCVGRTLFMREARLPKGEPPQQPICVLNIVLPEEIIPEAILPEHELHKYSFIQDSSGLESYQRVDLRLSDISNLLGADWVRLADELGVEPSDINRLKTEHPQSVAQQGLAMLRLWLSQAGNKAQASTLESALSRLGRDDIVQQCVFNVDHSGLQLLKDESLDASIRRSIPYSDKDIMKDSESVEDLSRTSLRNTGDISEKDDKEERKYEAEEKEVDEAKKSVLERRKEIEKRLSLEKPFEKKGDVISEKVALEKGEDFSEKEIAEEKRVSSPEEEPSELSFQQKRLSFEQGNKIIEMKPDKTTMKEVKERADERLLAEERRVAEKAMEETSLSFQEKRKSFEKGLKEEKAIKEKEDAKKEDLRRDSALFEGVSQGLVRLDVAFAAAPQVQDLLSPKVSKTPPPSPAEFKDITGTAAWTEEPSAVVPHKPDQSTDWAEKGKPDSTIDTSHKGAPRVGMREDTQSHSHPMEINIQPSVTSKGSHQITEALDIETQVNVVDKDFKYQFTMSVPDKQTFNETLTSISSFLESEKKFNDQTVKVKAKPDRYANLTDSEIPSSDDTEESQSRSESEPKSDKSFMNKMSKKLFGVFKKDDKEKSEKKKGRKKKHKKEKTGKDQTNEIQVTSTNMPLPATNTEQNTERHEATSEDLITIQTGKNILDSVKSTGKRAKGKTVSLAEDIVHRVGDEAEKEKARSKEAVGVAGKPMNYAIPAGKDDAIVIAQAILIKEGGTNIKGEKSLEAIKGDKVGDVEIKIKLSGDQAKATTLPTSVDPQNLLDDSNESNVGNEEIKVDSSFEVEDASAKAKEKSKVETSNVANKPSEATVGDKNRIISTSQAISESINEARDIMSLMTKNVDVTVDDTLVEGKADAPLVTKLNDKPITHTTVSITEFVGSKSSKLDCEKKTKQSDSLSVGGEHKNATKEKTKSFFGGFFSRSGDSADEVKSDAEGEKHAPSTEEHGQPSDLQSNTTQTAQSVGEFPTKNAVDTSHYLKENTTDKVVVAIERETNLLDNVKYGEYEKARALAEEDKMVSDPARSEIANGAVGYKSKGTKEKSKSFFSGIFSKSEEVEDGKISVIDTTLIIPDPVVLIKDKTKLVGESIDNKADELVGDSKEHSEADISVIVEKGKNVEKFSSDLSNETERSSYKTKIVHLTDKSKEEVLQIPLPPALDMMDKSSVEGTTKVIETVEDICVSENGVKGQTIALIQSESQNNDKTIDDGKTKVNDTAKSMDKKAKGAKHKSKSFFGGLFSKAGEISDDSKVKVTDSAPEITNTVAVVKDKTVSFSGDIIEKCDKLSSDGVAKPTDISMFAGKTPKTAVETPTPSANEIGDKKTNLEGEIPTIPTPKDVFEKIEGKSLSLDIKLTNKTLEMSDLNKDKFSTTGTVGIVEQAKDNTEKGKGKVVGFTKDITDSAKEANKDQTLDIGQHEIELVGKTVEAINTKVSYTDKAKTKKSKGGKDKSKSFFGGIFSKAGEIADDGKTEVANNVSETAGVVKDKSITLSGDILEKADDLASYGKLNVEDTLMIGSDMIKSAKGQGLSIDEGADATSNLVKKDQMKITQPTKNVSKEPEEMASFIAADVTDKTGKPVVLGKLSDPAVLINEGVIEKPKALIYKSEDQVICITENISESAKDSKEQSVALAQTELENSITDGKTLVSEPGRAISAKINKDKSKSLFGGIFGKAGEVSNEKKRHVVDSVSNISESAGADKNKTTIFSREVEEKANNLTIDGKQIVKGVATSGDTSKTTTSKTASVDVDVDDTTEIKVGGVTTTNQPKNDVTTEAEGRATLLSNIMAETKENVVLGQNKLTDTAVSVTEDTVRKATAITVESKSTITVAAKKIGESADEVKDQFLNIAKCEIELAEKTVEGGKTKVSDTGKVVSKKAKGAKDKSKSFFGGIFNKAGEIVDDGKTKVVNSVSAASETATVAKEKTVTFSEDIVEKADDLSRSVKSKVERITVISGEVVSSAKEKTMSTADKEVDIAANIVKDGKNKLIQSTKDTSNGAEVKTITSSADLTDKPKENLALSKDTLSKSTIVLKKGIAEKAKDTAGDSKVKVVDTVDDICESVKDVKDKAIEQSHSMIEEMEKSVEHGKKKFDNTGKALGKKAKGAKDKSKTFFGGIFSKAGEIVDDGKIKVAASVSAASETAVVEKDKNVTFSDDITEKADDLSGDTKSKAEAMTAPVGKIEKSAKEKAVSIADKGADKSSNLLSVEKTTIIHITDVSKGVEEKSLSLSADVVDKTKEIIVSGKDTLSDSTIFITDSLTEKAKRIDDKSAEKMVGTIEDIHESTSGAKGKAFGKLETGLEQIEKAAEDGKTNLSDTGKISSEKAKGAKDQSKIFFSGTFGKDGEIEDDEKSNLVDSVSGVSKVDSVSKESPVVFRGSKANDDLVSSGETIVKDVGMFADETTKSAKDISISTSINRANLGNETTIIQPTLDVFKEDEKNPTLLNAHVTEKSTENVVLSKDSIFELSDSTITLTEDIPANARDFTGDSKANVFEQVENFLGFNQGAKDQTIEKIQESSLKIGETVRDEKTLLINAKKPASKTKELEDESKNLFSEMFFKAGEILDNGKSKLVDSASAIPDTEAQSKDKTVKCGGDIVHKVDDLAFSGKTKVDDVAMLVGDFVKSAKEAVISSANEGDDKTANLLIESKTTITQSAKDAYKAAAGKPVSVLAANVADKTKETTELGKEKLETAVFVAEGLVQKANDISEDVEANVVDTKKEIIVSTKRLKDQTIAIAQNKFEEVGKASVCDTGKAISKETKDKGEIFFDSILSKSLKVVDDGKTKVGNSASNIADTSNLIKDKTLSFSQGAVDNASPLISGGKDKIKDVTVVVGDPVIKSKDKALSAVMDYSDKATTDIREGKQKNVQVTQLVETSFDREAADVSNDINVAQVSMKRKFTDNISFDPKDIVKTTKDKLDKVKDQLDCNTKQVRGSSNNVNNQTDFATEVASKKVVTPTVVSKVDLGETKSVEFDLSISETGISTEKAKSFLEGIFTKAEEIADESKGLAKELTYPTSQSTKEDESSSDSKTKRPNEKSEKSRALNERKAVDTTKRVTETTQDPKDQTESVPLSAMKVGESLKEVLETAVFDRKTIVDQIQPTVDQLSLKTSEVNCDRTIKPCEKNIEGNQSKFTETLRSSVKPAVGFEETTVTGTTELGSAEEFCDITKTTLCSKDDHASFVKGQKENMKVSLSENVNKGKEESEFLLGSISSKSVKKGETNKKEVVGVALSIKQSVDDTKHDTPSCNLPSISTQKSTQEANTKNNDDKLNNILIDMLIEQECMKTPSHDVSSLQASEIKNQFSAEASNLPEKHDIEVSEKAAMSAQSGSFKTAASFGEIESLISEKDLKMEITKEVPTRHTSYVTTPTMQRRKIGGSQRLSREERPSLRDVSHILDYSSSDEDETNNYIVTEPSDRSPQSSVIFHVESEDESYLKMSDSSSDPEIEVTEMSRSPISSSKKQRTLPVKEIQKHAKDPTKPKVKSDKNIQKVERRFERMASETLETDPASKYSADREFQRMVSQLSNEEVDACLNQWDEGGLTPSEELDSTKDTIEGDLDPDVEALPEAFIESTNPFFSSSTQWVEFEHDISNTPSSIFWAFDTTPTSAIIQPNELDIPIKTAPTKGESAGEEAKRSPVPPTTRESEETLLDLAAGLQDNKGSGSGPSSTK